MRYRLFLLCLLLVGLVRAELSMPAIFSDGMVLQQQTSVRLWGEASALGRVTVETSWNGKVYKVTADDSGRWSVQVATPSYGGPYKVTVSSGKETVVLGDVLVGEVWLCSGQSNMEEPMKGYKAQGIEGGLPAIMQSSDRELRLFTVKKSRQLEPQDTLAGSWKHAAPQSVGDFSATGYFFGRFMREALNIPIGLIYSSIGGTPIEAWMGRETLEEFPHVKFVKPGEKFDWKSPTVLYNAMIRPIVGYGIKGVIWYQGESNYENPENYAELMKRMVSSWRSAWGIGEFPFYYCQIAPYEYGRITKEGDPVINSAYLREAQMLAETQIPFCAMAVMMDIGLEIGIHPRNKRVAGERLAMNALVKTYGFKADVESPRYSTMEIEDSTAVITFDHSPRGLECTLGQYPEGFEIAGPDSVFHEATAFIKWNTNKVYVTCPEVKHPVAVRYAFHNWAEATLYGQNGMPVSSFRTDSWPVAPDYKAVRK